MAKGGPRFYAVAHGRKIGIFRSWDECKAQVDGFSKAIFQSFPTQDAAAAYLSSKSPLAHEEHAPPAAPPRRQAGPVGGEASLLSPTTVVQVPTPRGAAQPLVLKCCAAEANVRPLDVYVDGSCLSNGRGSARGGYGGFYGDGDPRNFSEPLSPSEKQTNNRGELKAAIYVIQHACETGLSRPLHIHTDSRYVIDGITKWIYGWKKRDFHQVENVDLWLMLDELVQRRCREFSQGGLGDARDAVVFHHVKGHSGVYGNEQADKLAVMGSMKAMEQQRQM